MGGGAPTCVFVYLRLNIYISNFLSTLSSARSILENMAGHALGTPVLRKLHTGNTF